MEVIKVTGICPEKLIENNKKGKLIYTVRFDFEETTGGWSFNQFDISGKQFTYDGLVNKLVSAKYPQDKMQAIINNYLLDGSNPDIKAEFNDMQSWRKHAKEVAKEVISLKSSKSN